MRDTSFAQELYQCDRVLGPLRGASAQRPLVEGFPHMFRANREDGCYGVSKL